MKVIFIVICLWRVTASHSECNYKDQSVRNSTAGQQDTTFTCDFSYNTDDNYDNVNLNMVCFRCNHSLVDNYINIECNDNKNGGENGLSCEGHIESDQLQMSDSPDYENTYDCESYCANNIINTQTSTAEVTSDSDISFTIVSEANTDACNSQSVVVLGALVGLLVVLVAVTTSGWVWTYLVLRKRGIKNISSKPIRSSIDELNNPTYEGDDLLCLQPPVPAYEIIELHPREGNNRESSQQDEDGYQLLNRNQQKGATNIMSRGQETIHEDWKEESYSKLELTTASNNGQSQGQGGEYSNLETLTVKLDTTEKSTIESTIGEGATNGVSQKGNDRTMDKNNSDDDALQLENGNSQNGQDKAEAVSQPMVNTAMDIGHTGNKPTEEDPETDCDQVTSSFKLHASEDDA